MKNYTETCAMNQVYEGLCMKDVQYKAHTS